MHALLLVLLRKVSAQLFVSAIVLALREKIQIELSQNCFQVRSR